MIIIIIIIMATPKATGAAEIHVYALLPPGFVFYILSLT
jgi:hypothetical protein